MKTLACLAGLVAGLSTIASADVKNVGGMVCMHYSSSEAPKTAEYVTSGGRLCNNSEERLRVTCPLTQDAGNGERITATIDYVNWNTNGLGGEVQSHPEEEFLCSVFTRTRHADGYYWGEWKTANTPFTNGYGETPTGMTADAPEIDPGFSHVICYIPEKYGSSKSCVSHIRYSEE